MKRKILKTALFLCTFICLSVVLIFSASAATVASGDFVYDINGTQATLTQYKGTAATVTIPAKVNTANVTAIGYGAFNGKNKITSVTIPASVTSIGEVAFNDCKSLAKIVLPQNLTAIGASAFWGCTSLKSVVIFDKVLSIGTNAFKYCHEDLTAYVVKNSFAESWVKSQESIKLAYRFVDSVKLSASALTLEAGASKSLTYTVSPSNVYYKGATFTSSNTKVATVDAKGKITAVAPGTATITVAIRDASGKKASCKITVTPQQVKSFSQTATTVNSYTLNWAKSSGAAKYRIYQFNFTTNKWDTLAYTTANYYKVTKLAAGSSQYYRVLAYTSVGGTIYRAPLSETFKARPTYPAAVSTITYKPAHNFINLSWVKPANATGYRIYSYNTATKKYTFVAATTKTSLQIKNLQPNTTYTYMVRAYMKHSGGYIYAAYSPLTPCTTRPDYVSGFAVKPNSVYVSKVTLKWTAQSEVAGYRIAMLDKDSGNYNIVATVNGADVSEYTIDNLDAGTTYSFKIQSYSKKSGATVFGYLSTAPISVTTNSRPASTAEAFNGFISAYNSSKNSSADFNLVKDTIVSDFAGENQEDYEAVLSSIAEGSISIFVFENGIEKTSKAPVTSVIAPAGAYSTLEYEQVKDIEFDDDGNGYRITFSLPAETDGRLNAQLTELIDWDSVAAANQGFTLKGCSYEGTTVEAKVNNGHVDDMTVTVPVRVQFTLNEADYEFTQTITKKLLFIW